MTVDLTRPTDDLALIDLEAIWKISMENNLGFTGFWLGTFAQ